MIYATELSSAFLQALNDARQAFLRDFISSWVDLASQSSLNFLAATVMFAASAFLQALNDARQAFLR